MLYCRCDTVLTGTWVLPLWSSGLLPSSGYVCCPTLKYRLWQCLDTSQPRTSTMTPKFQNETALNIPTVDITATWHDETEGLKILVHDADDDVNRRHCRHYGLHQHEMLSRQFPLQWQERLICPLQFATHKIRKTEINTRSYLSRAMNTLRNVHSVTNRGIYWKQSTRGEKRVGHVWFLQRSGGCALPTVWC
jgi:hypothetical protein